MAPSWPSSGVRGGVLGQGGRVAGWRPRTAPAPPPRRPPQGLAIPREGLSAAFGCFRLLSARLGRTLGARQQCEWCEARQKGQRDKGHAATPRRAPPRPTRRVEREMRVEGGVARLVAVARRRVGAGRRHFPPYQLGRGQRGQQRGRDDARQAAAGLLVTAPLRCCMTALPRPARRLPCPLDTTTSSSTMERHTLPLA